MADKSLTYHVSEFNVGDKVLVRNHIRGVWDTKYYMMEWQLELMDESGKIHKVNVQDVKITYPVDELIVFTWW